MTITKFTCPPAASDMHYIIVRLTRSNNNIYTQNTILILALNLRTTVLQLYKLL
jgi:hypothetical protein